MDYIDNVVKEIKTYCNFNEHEDENTASNIQNKANFDYLINKQKETKYNMFKINTQKIKIKDFIKKYGIINEASACYYYEDEKEQLMYIVDKNTEELIITLMKHYYSNKMVDGAFSLPKLIKIMMENNDIIRV
jgi:hypothetical protein